MAVDYTYDMRAPAPYPDNISLGEVDGVSSLNKFAYRDSIQAADGNVLIWPDGTTDSPTILTSASTFTVAYNNATDGLGTTGALSLLPTYIDSDEVFRNEIDTSVENHLGLIDPVGFNFSPRDVVYMTANTDSNNTGVSARLSIHRYKNP